MIKKKKRMRVPVFDALTNEWLGTIQYGRSTSSKEHLNEMCEFCIELADDECWEVSEAIGFIVESGWYDVYGSNCIFVVIGE